MNNDCVISVRLTEEEKSVLMSGAQRAGVSVSELLRSLVVVELIFRGC